MNGGGFGPDAYMEPEEEWEREGLLDPAWEKQQKKVTKPPPSWSCSYPLGRSFDKVMRVSGRRAVAKGDAAIEMRAPSHHSGGWLCAPRG
jgi:hypothetical protein